MGYEEPEITTAQVLAAISDDGNKLNPLTAAEIAAALPLLAYRWDWNAVQDLFVQVSGTVTQIVDQGNDGGAIVNISGDTEDAGFGNFYIPEEATYTLHLIMDRATSTGIADVFIDGASVGTIDTYGTADANFPFSISLGTLAVGLHGLRIKVNSKNGSSSGYAVKIQSMSVVKT